MNKLLLSALTALSAFALVAPAQAGVLLPQTYADQFCGLRDMGVDIDDAMRAATVGSMIDGTPVVVMLNGQEYDADVIQAGRAVSQRCPQHM
jgi:hypothetical protein